MSYQLIFRRSVSVAWIVGSLVACSGGGDGDGGSSTDSGTTTNASSTTGTTSGSNATSGGSDATSGGSDATSSGGSSDGSSNGSSSTANGAGGATNGSTDQGSANGASSTSGGNSCDVVECLRPYECATSCDVEPSYVGCCPCADGMVDQFVDCSEAGGDCGGATCGDNEYCAKPTSECDSDALGTCQGKPDVCTQEYAPVCGCDGMTYGNACGAEAAGVNVASEGECS